MATTAPPIPQTTTATQRTHWPIAHLATVLFLWFALFAASIASPPLQDDADATHAQAAQAMLTTGDLTTLHVDGIRYLEKPPLPYWIAALSMHFLGQNSLAIHLPLALTVLALALLGYAWARRAFPTPATPDRAALYTALFTLTSTGTFLFTRVFIPDALLSLLLALALYAFLLTITDTPATQTPGGPFIRGFIADEWGTPESRTNDNRVPQLFSPGNNQMPQNFSPGNNRVPQDFSPGNNRVPQDFSPGNNRVPRGFSLGSHSPAKKLGFSPKVCFPSAAPYLLWTALALAVLTKGLVALVLFFGAIAIFLTATRQLHKLPLLQPKTGILLFLAIAAPWHILAGLRNAHGPAGHGFFWFYFVNEHVLRFLGRRIPRDYNKLPALLYWSLHLVWLFPWSLFAPAALLTAYRAHRAHQSLRELDPHTGLRLSRLDLLRSRNLPPLAPSFTRSTVLLLATFSALVLVFFSLSTNQEYYTFPIYLPVLLLLAAALTKAQIPRDNRAPQNFSPADNRVPRGFSPADNRVPRGFSLGSHRPAENTGVLTPAYHRLLTASYATFTLLGATIAAALALGLYTSRHLPYVADIGALLAHRGVGDYTLSLSRFFDLTGPSFAALRLPSAIAALAFALGPAIAWLLHHRRRPHAAILTVAATSATFLLAAHIALIRFTPMLSSKDFADTILSLEASHAIAPNTQVLLFGDQAYGSSIPFYLHRQVFLPVFLVDGRTTSMQFGSAFPDAPAIFLTPQQLAAQWALGPRKILFVPLEHRDDFDRLHLPSTLLAETSGKALYTDRPLTRP